MNNITMCQYMNNRIFTVEYNSEQECVEIHLNEDGAAELMRVLQECRESDSNEHVHLLTPSWGGNMLTEMKQNESAESKLINHLKIMYWKK